MAHTVTTACPNPDAARNALDAWIAAGSDRERVLREEENLELKGEGCGHRPDTRRRNRVPSRHLGRLVASVAVVLQ